MRYRLVHSQTHRGTLLVSDIDSGLPNEEFGMYRKLPVYLPYHKTAFVTDGNGMATVVTDTGVPGFIDLVPSDKVKLSADRGVIKGLADEGLLTVVEIPTGALGAPTIATATFADGGGNGAIAVTGTNFVSYSPDVTTITVTGYNPAGTESSVDLVAAAGVVVGATSITIDAANHGFGITTVAQRNEVAVTANGAGLYQITINGIDVEFTAVAETIEQIRDGLIAAALALDLDDDFAITTVDADTISFEALVAGDTFEISVSAPNNGLALTTVAEASGITSVTVNANGQSVTAPVT